MPISCAADARSCMLEGKAANNNKNCPHIAPFATACGKRRQAEEHTLSKQRKHICTAERTHSGLYGNNKQKQQQPHATVR